MPRYVAHVWVLGAVLVDALNPIEGAKKVKDWLKHNRGENAFLHSLEQEQTDVTPTPPEPMAKARVA